MNLRTCVAPSGEFIYGIHRPCFRVDNLRTNDYIKNIGWFSDGAPMDNRVNFPESYIRYGYVVEGDYVGYAHKFVNAIVDGLERAADGPDLPR